jgi:hypothetical protein
MQRMYEWLFGTNTPAVAPDAKSPQVNTETDDFGVTELESPQNGTPRLTVDSSTLAESVPAAPTLTDDEKRALSSKPVTFNVVKPVPSAPPLTKAQENRLYTKPPVFHFPIKAKPVPLLQNLAPEPDPMPVVEYGETSSPRTLNIQNSSADEIKKPAPAEVNQSRVVPASAVTKTEIISNQNNGALDSGEQVDRAEKKINRRQFGKMLPRILTHFPEAFVHQQRKRVVNQNQREAVSAKKHNFKGAFFKGKAFETPDVPHYTLRRAKVRG